VFVGVILSDDHVQGTFHAALRTQIDAGVKRSALVLFSSQCASAMNTDMKVVEFSFVLIETAHGCTPFLLPGLHAGKWFFRGCTTEKLNCIPV